MSDLQLKLKTLQGLLPSQRQWMERLTFQLEFNPYQLVHIVGGPGTGKSTLCLSIAELLSDDFNLALLKVEPELPAFRIRQHLLESWFGFCPDGNKPLMQLIGERQSNLPLALVLDQAENVPAELWAELSQVPCLVVAASLQPDPHAELNLPLAPITLEDAEQLLQTSEFSTLTVADRLDQAEGNLHVLLDPTSKPKHKQTLVNLPTKPASILPPLMTFVIGMLVIAGVVVFWFWTERDLRQQPGVGQLTYLPQEEEVGSATPDLVKPNNVESKKVVKELVDKLDVVKGNDGSVAIGMAQQERFDDSAEQVSAEQVTPETIDASHAVVKPEAANSKVADKSVENVSGIAEKPVAEQSNIAGLTVEPSDVVTDAGQSNASEQLVAQDNSGSQSDDELPTSLGQSTQLEPETTFEDEIAAEQQSRQSNPSASDTVVETKVNTSAESLESSKATTAETTASNTDELADELSIQPTEPVKPANSSYRYAETTLLGLSGEAKALQLVVFSNENALNSFKQSYPQLQTYTYARTKNGQKQLVVVLAPFSDHAAAKAQINRLPAAFQNAFVKAISEIHSEISTN